MKIFRLANVAAACFTRKIKLLIGISFINALLESFTLILLFGLLSSLADAGSQGGRLYEITKYFGEKNYLYQAVLILFAATIRYISGLWVEWNTNKLWVRLREKFQNEMLERHLQCPLSYLLHKKIGEHTHNIMDAPAFASVFYLHFIRFISTGLIFIILLVTLFLISPILFIIAAIIALLYAIVIKKTSENISYKMGQQQAEAIKNERELTSEGLYGIRYIKIFGLINNWQSEFAYYADTAAISMHRAGYWNTLPNRTMEYLLIFIFIGLIIYGLSYQSDITAAVPTLAIYFLAIARILPSLSILGNGRMQMMNALPNLENIILLRDEIPKDEIKHGSLQTPDISDSIIKYCNVSISYGENAILKNLSFQINPRQLTVIVGTTGHGKSTIVDLLLRFIKSDDGEIIINDTEINEYELTSWWKKFAYVGQEPFLFQGTIRENLCIGNNNYSDSEIYEAIKHACIDNFIDCLPNKLNTVLAERGQSLSVGQKQRLALARALLLKSDVLIMDEPTSAIDKETESRIIENLVRMKKNRTIIMVTHRLELTNKADTILVIKDGRLKEQGNFTDLIRNGTYFRKMYGLEEDVVNLASS